MRVSREIAPVIGAIVGALALAALLSWGTGCWDEAQARTKQLRLTNSRAGTSVRPNDWSADGGDAATAADGGDAAADGGDAAADGGDAAADGGDAQSSPLDDHASTLTASWNFIGMHGDAGSSTNPLVKYAGSCTVGNCDIPEQATPNQTGGNATTGFTYIGAGGIRLNQLEFNNSSGGWGKNGSWTGPGASGASGMLIRAVIKTPSVFGTFTVLNMNNAAGGDTLKMTVDATSGGRFICAYDDGPGANATGVMVITNSGKDYFCDCFVESNLKATMCCNGTCVTGATASGSSGLAAPDTVGLFSSPTNTQIWTQYGLEIQYYQDASSWWTSTVHGTECALTLSDCTP